jgi:hypothetical protein
MNSVDITKIVINKNIIELQLGDEELANAKNAWRNS